MQCTVDVCVPPMLSESQLNHWTMILRTTKAFSLHVIVSTETLHCLYPHGATFCQPLEWAWKWNNPQSLQKGEQPCQYFRLCRFHIRKPAKPIGLQWSCEMIINVVLRCWVFVCLFFINLFTYFWLCWVFAPARRLLLVAASGGYSLLWCAGFSLRWLLLLRSTGPRCVGFSSCSMQGSVVVARGL